MVAAWLDWSDTLLADIIEAGINYRQLNSAPLIRCKKQWPP